MTTLARRFTVVGAMLAAVLALGIQPAHAVSGTWSLSTTGSSSSGSYKTSGTTYTFTGTIKDTKADGSCAYIAYRPQVHYGRTGLWNSVGWTGYEKRIEVCGSGSKKSANATIDVYSKMSSLDHKLGDRIRVEIRVCRNVNNASDNCAKKITAAIDL